MRTCEACGYLAFGGDVCKHCGAALAAEEPVTVGAPAGTAVAAGADRDAPSPAPAPPVLPVPPWARHAAVPPAGSNTTVVEATTPAAFGAPSLGAPRPGWTPATPPAAPPVPAPRASRRPRRLRAAIGAALAALIGVGVAGALHHGDRLPAGTQAFVAGHGVEYRSPDDTYTARFPTAPTPTEQRIAIGSTTATLEIAHVQTDDYEVVTASIVLPISIPPSQVDVALKSVLDTGTRAENAKIESEQPTTIEGARGLQITATGPDGYDVDMVAISSGSRVFMLGTHAKTGTTRLYDALLRSFVMF